MTDRLAEVERFKYDDQTLDILRENAGNVTEAWEIEIGRIIRLYKGATIKGSVYRHNSESKRYLEGQTK